MNRIRDADFMEQFPPALKKDMQMEALGRLVAEELHITAEETRKNIIYTDIEQLSEKWLDVLAYDLHVDWYDYDLPVEIKREVIRNSIQVHKKLGTPAAVKELLRAAFGEGQVKEWFEYGGRPYWFKIGTAGILTKNNVFYFSDMIWKVKNTRSHIQALEVYRNTEQEIYAGAGMSLVYKPAAIMDGYYVEQDVEQRVYAGAAGSAAYRPAAVMDGYHVKQENGMHVYAGTAISAGYKPAAVMDGFRQKRSASSAAYTAIGSTSIFRNTITE